jgi:hypothetical protein
VDADLFALDAKEVEARRVQPGLQRADEPGQAQAGQLLELLHLERAQRRRALDHVLVEDVGQELDQRLALEPVERLAQGRGDLPQVRPLRHESSRGGSPGS